MSGLYKNLNEFLGDGEGASRHDEEEMRNWQMFRSQRTVTNTSMTLAVKDLRVLFQRQISRMKENWGTEPKMRQCGSSADYTEKPMTSHS